MKTTTSSSLACLLLLAICLWSASPAARAASAAELLEKGIYAEETQGELQAATGIYQEIINDTTADRSLVAQARLRLGICQLKLGNKSRAQSALDQLREEFPDQDSLQAIVEQHMPRVLDEIVSLIGRNYIQEVDRKELFQTAVRAMMGRLDARGQLRTNDLEFLTTNELKQITEQIDQKVVGIGVVLKAEGSQMVVQSPLEGSPALAIGLRAGDRIVTIDGAPTPTKIEPVVRLLRGVVGTSVTVGIQRGDEKVRDVTLVRDAIRLPSVSGFTRKADNSWSFLLKDEDRIGYIRVSEVGRQSANEVQVALEEITGHGLKALILDLRDNPGGWLDGAVAIADMFVERGRIVTVKGRQGETPYEAKLEGTFSGFPMVVLVNRRTASAAEIVAACLQDHRRAVIVGERTFGQGIVRSLFPLESGIGAVKLPVAAHYRPSGRPVNRFPGATEADEWGVSPDPGFEVSLSDEEMVQIQTTRSRRSILKSGEAEAPEEAQDRQMERALEWLREKMKQVK